MIKFMYKVLDEWERNRKLLGDDLGIAIFGSARFNEANYFFKAAVRCAQHFAKLSFAITTGGGPGIMFAGNLGAYGISKSIGLNIHLPFEQSGNPKQDARLEFEYFFLRINFFLLFNRAMAVFPGGYGTLMEIFKVIVFNNRNEAQMRPIVLIDEFYRGLMDVFDAWEKQGLLKKPKETMLAWKATEEEARDYLFRRLIEQWLFTDPEESTAAREKLEQKDFQYLAERLQARVPRQNDFSIHRFISEILRASRRMYKIGPAVMLTGGQTITPDSKYGRLSFMLARSLSEQGKFILRRGTSGISACVGNACSALPGLRSFCLYSDRSDEEAPIPSPDKIHFHYDAALKTVLLQHAEDGIVFFPGRFGNLDMLFETLCLIQTGKIDPVPIVLVGKEWHSLFQWIENVMVPAGTIDKEDLRLIEIVDVDDDSEAALKAVVGKIEAKLKEWKVSCAIANTINARIDEHRDIPFKQRRYVAEHEVRDNLRAVLNYGPFTLEEIEALTERMSRLVGEQNWTYNDSRDIAALLIIVAGLDKDAIRDNFSGMIDEPALARAWGEGAFLKNNMQGDVRASGYYSGEQESEWINRDFGLAPGEVIFDILCSRGKKTVDIARYNPTARVYGLDANPRSIGEAVGYADSVQVSNLNFILRDIRPQWGGIPAQDNSVAALTMLYMPLFGFDSRVKKEIFGEMVRVLKHGGKIYWENDDDTRLFIKFARENGIGMRLRSEGENSIITIEGKKNERGTDPSGKIIDVSAAGDSGKVEAKAAFPRSFRTNAIEKERVYSFSRKDFIDGMWTGFWPIMIPCRDIFQWCTCVIFVDKEGKIFLSHIQTDPESSLEIERFEREWQDYATIDENGEFAPVFDAQKIYDAKTQVLIISRHQRNPLAGRIKEFLQSKGLRSEHIHIAALPDAQPVSTIGLLFHPDSMGLEVSYAAENPGYGYNIFAVSRYDLGGSLENPVIVRVFPEKILSDNPLINVFFHRFESERMISLLPQMLSPRTVIETVMDSNIPFIRKIIAEEESKGEEVLYREGLAVLEDFNRLPVNRDELKVHSWTEFVRRDTFGQYDLTELVVRTWGHVYSNRDLLENEAAADTPLQAMLEDCLRKGYRVLRSIQIESRGISGKKPAEDPAVLSADVPRVIPRQSGVFSDFIAQAV
ncbi:MAG: LOG family protein [Candidatus Omnitrophica bacterium]|nr:LOG family protein [Candidatus Omnitrophota bacterium]